MTVYSPHVLSVLIQVSQSLFHLGAEQVEGGLVDGMCDRSIMQVILSALQLGGEAVPFYLHLGMQLAKVSQLAVRVLQGLVRLAKLVCGVENWPLGRSG